MSSSELVTSGKVVSFFILKINNNNGKFWKRALLNYILKRRVRYKQGLNISSEQTAFIVKETLFSYSKETETPN